jgi:putative membrane protein
MHGAWQAGPWDLVWPLFWLLPLVLFGLLVVLPWRRREHPGWNRGSAPTRETAIAILEERFARGEIDDEEYLRRRSTLDSL